MIWVPENSVNMKLIIPSFNGLYQEIRFPYEFNDETGLVKFYVSNQCDKVLVNNGELVKAEVVLIDAKMVPRDQEYPTKIPFEISEEDLESAILKSQANFGAPDISGIPTILTNGMMGLTDKDGNTTMMISVEEFDKFKL